MNKGNEDFSLRMWFEFTSRYTSRTWDYNTDKWTYTYKQKEVGYLKWKVIKIFENLYYGR